MGKVPVILKIELAVKEAEDEIAIGKNPDRQTSDRSPIPNLFIIDGPGNDRACERMSNAVHG